MTSTRFTPEEIAEHQRAADQFFRKPRGIGAVLRLRNERYSPELRALVAEARTARTWADMEKALSDRLDAFHRAVASPLLDDVSRNLLRRPRGIRRQSADRLERNQRAADRFFDLINGLDFSDQITGHSDWVKAQTRRRERAARVFYLQFMSAPVDPLTEEEARMVGTKLPRALREAARREAQYRRGLRGPVNPVGMTLERALEIAEAAQKREEP